MEAFRNRIKAPLADRGEDYLYGFRGIHVHDLVKIICGVTIGVWLLLAVFALPTLHWIVFVISFAGVSVNLIAILANLRRLDIGYFVFLVVTLFIAFALIWSIIYNIIAEPYTVGFFLFFVLLLLVFGLTLYGWSVVYRDYRHVFENEAQQPKYFGLLREQIIAFMR
ncbi:unnamed protein product [Bursaphelenchus xylophilus]|uniref:(pine wood nematode) hypothetical protein n=1 Tax=Bursaphelenchus xylophilus TaxID=6326 RepID=A0A1I7SDZ8_BURXY|nr:unnamed protein product [Bursaphelenchus xylophilus]CAG9113085.1 unnamed protein product [Bursaphelenchus xylophilus]